MKKVLFYVCSFTIFFAFFISCQIGLGKEVDLEAPVITLTKMQSGSVEVDSSHFGGGVYCKKTVSFFGTATDNVKVQSVNAEIKWNSEVEFQPYTSTSLSGDSFQFDFTFDKTGIAYVKFVVTDEAGNYNVKSSKVVTLLVDDEAPVGKSWYINRKLNGIQYSLKDLEELKALDLSLPENKDAAQNVAFSIHSAFNDEMGIKPGSISIQIKDENGNFVCTVPNSTSNDYSPVFDITHKLLVEGGSQYSMGKHYLQVWYNAEDVVTLPESNKAQDIQVDGGWFIWWPESDLPRISQKPALDTVTNSILLNVSEAVTVTIFDDDALAESTCALLTEAEYGQIKDLYKDDYSKLISIVPQVEQKDRTKKVVSDSTKRDEVLSFIAPKSPQVMYLVSCVKDVNGKIATNEYVVNVTDATSPILYIASPSNNSVPAVEMKDGNKKAIVTIQGQVIDTAGCTNLEFVWVPDAVAADNVKKSQLAKNYLTGSSSLQTGLKKWSVKLGKEEDASNGYRKQDFSFEIDLLNDFVFGNINEKNINKFFVVKVTRKDGKYALQEYKLSSDTTKPVIKSISPENTTQIIGSTKDLNLEFYAEKENGLAIDETKYKISGKVDGADITIPKCEIINGHYTTTIPKETLKEYETSGKRPIYTFTAADIFGNENSTSYTIVVSSLPQLNSITSTSPDTCKKGDIITFNANFSNTIDDNGSFTTNPPKLILQGFSDNKDREAIYVSGVGSPTLVFEYETVEGDASGGITIKGTEDDGYIDVNKNTALEDGIDVHLKNTSIKVLDGKTITVEAVSPTVIAYSVDTSVTEKSDEKYYLNQGKTITATLTLSENVFVQGSPKFKFTNGIELDFEGSNANSITFSGTVPAEKNGTLEFKKSECIINSQTITDTSGNILLPSTESSKTTTDIIIDTTAPKEPTVKAIDGTALKDNGNYNTAVEFKIESEDNDVVKYECSLDAGTSWEEATGGTGEVSQSYAELTAKVTDKAGNVSEYPTPIKLNIESSFPDFSVDCLTPNGDYKQGKDIEFRIYFEKEVILLDKNAKISIGTNNNTQRFATVKDSTSVDTPLKQIDFVYKVDDEDDFNISLSTDGVNLGDSVQDLFGFNQGIEEPTSIPSSINIKCDGVAPTVNSAIPNDGTSAAPSYVADVNNIYTTGNQIQITFSEPVQKGSGNIILRQTAGWAIPPVLTAEEFNTICAKLSDTEKNILALRNSDGTLMEDVEDLRLHVAYRNDKYHGTGQFIGPYKKMTQGLKQDENENGYYIPDTDVKYVLDFDMDIHDTSGTTKAFGTTFNKTTANVSGTENDFRIDSKITTRSKNYYGERNYTYDEKALATPRKTPNDQKNISVNDIRNVLETAGYHKRELDVTSPLVEILPDDEGENTICIIKFPAGLIDKTDALPNGREWELVLEEGAFLDMPGNVFSSQNSIITFYSDKVAAPVVRVDRYSYGLGMYQSDESGNKGNLITGDDIEPTAYVRVKIDCETKDAAIFYDSSSIKRTADESSLTTENSTDSNFATSKKSSITELTLNEFNTTDPTSNYTGVFAAGSGDYKESAKQFIIAKAKKDNFDDSAKGVEGIYQTVVHFVTPRCNAGYEAAQGTYRTDWSIRGTTGKFSEPSIAPYPLRDTPNGSPYLKRTYKNENDYYWLSYEILVDSSLCAAGWAISSSLNIPYGGSGWYNWAKNWALMWPGQITRVEGMQNWE